MLNSVSKYSFKIIVLVTFFTISPISWGQNWKTFENEEMGDVTAGSRYLKINPEDNSVWFSSNARLYLLNESGLATTYILPEYVSGMFKLRDFVHYQGELWLIDYDEGLFSFDGLGLEYRADIQLGSLISIDNEDSLLIGTAGGFGEGYFAYKNGFSIMYPDDPTGFFLDRVYQVFEDSYGRKWMSHWELSSGGVETGDGAGYSIYQEGAWSFESPTSSNIPSWNVKKFIESPTNQIYAATDSGLCRYDEFSNDWVIYNKSNTNMPSSHIQDLKYDEAGRLWVHFKGEAIGYSYNLTDWTIFDETNSPPNYDEVKALDIDTLGNVWILEGEKLHVLTLDNFEGWLEVDEKQRIAELSVYPNPVQSNLQFTISDPVKDIQITNLLGQSFDVNLTSKNTVDCSELSSGRYILSVFTESGWSRESFVVN